MKNNNEEEEKIKLKIINVDKQINDDLLLIPEYKLLTVYNKLSKIINQDERKYLYLRNKFIFIDKTLTGYINLKDFYEILKNNLPLELDELKLILCDPALKNKINPKLYQYKPFFDLIRHFNETNLLKMKQDYNIEQNPYIIKLKKEINEKKLNIKTFWENSFKNGLKCNKENFNLLFVELKSKYNFHKLEIDYIFDIICKLGEDNIKYEYFIEIMKKKNSADIRVIYFKGLREFKQKEKEKNEEKEKILINYYPNLLENNNNTTSNPENISENTKYLIIKGEDIINNTENNDIEKGNDNNNKNEKFILGNIPNKINNSLQISDNFESPKKAINSMTGTIDISESLAIKAKPKIIEDKTINEFELNNKENKPIHYKKYLSKVYDLKTDINMEKENYIKTYNDKSKTLTKIEKDNIINEKIKISNDKVFKILDKHEEYKVLKLYSSLKNQMNLINDDILKKFSNKDSQNSKYLSINDFISILQNDLKINIIKEDLNLLLNTLENQDNQNSLFSYEEFLNNIKNLTDKNIHKIETIKNLGIMNFNTYFIELKRNITKNNIDFNSIFNACSSDKINLNLNEFIILLKSLNYELEDVSEYKYIFNILSNHPYKKLLSKKVFNVFIYSETISEEKFINDGKIENNFQENKNKFWYKFIPKFDVNKNKFDIIDNYKKVFDEINEQKTKYGINNISDLFSSLYEVNLNGNIKKEEFINALKSLEINNMQIINDLLNNFEDSYDKNEFFLINFIGLFESIDSNKEKNVIPPHNFKTYPKDPNIVFKNNYGFFTSFDLVKIRAFCLSINEKINFIKRQTMDDYFTKFDFFHKGFFTLEQIKAILINDLNYKKYELIDLFLCYALENIKKNEHYIINLNNLIDIMNKFVENKNEIDQEKTYNTLNYTNEIFNILLNSTIMNIRLNKKENTNYYFSPNSGIE